MALRPSMNREQLTPAVRRTAKKVLPGDELEAIDAVVREVQTRLLAQRGVQGEWNFHAHLGLHFMAQHLLFVEYLGFQDTRLDRSTLRRKLLESQLGDGSWLQLPDLNLQSGEVNVTIFNYWALKVLGEDPQSPAMLKARAYVLGQGGLEKSALFTRIILALFGNYSWAEIPYIPHFLFAENLPINYSDFSQWVIPHLIGIAYLRHNRVSKWLGPQFDVRELIKDAPLRKRRPRPKSPTPLLDDVLVEKMLAMQQHRGSWGGYSLSTLLSVVALDHYQKHLLQPQTRIQHSVIKGIEFVEQLYFVGKGAYLGALMDGKCWDTILCTSALMDSGVALESLYPSINFILSRQQEGGGFPYGDDFEYAPDVDDTAEVLLMLRHVRSHYPQQIERAVRWLFKMQNKDGGWGAFDRNNNGNVVAQFLTRNFNDSVDLFDDSSADVTGHILEALGAMGYSKMSSPVIARAVRYLRSTQESNGTWLGRWGVNYIYGTSAALAGLIAVGESSELEYIQKALRWLLTKQNADGGFGESTQSYGDVKLAGKGLSTPSQTAWALLALCQGGLGRRVAAQRAAQYLLGEFSASGEWRDRTVVGTGHPGLLYMNYPVYTQAFPLMALAQYRRAQRDYKEGEGGSE